MDVTQNVDLTGLPLAFRFDDMLAPDCGELKGCAESKRTATRLSWLFFPAARAPSQRP